MTSAYHRLTASLAHRTSVTAVAFSPDAVLLATATADGGIYVWRVEDCVLLYSVQGNTTVLSIAWRGEDSTFVYGSESGNAASCAVFMVSRARNFHRCIATYSTLHRLGDHWSSMAFLRIVSQSTASLLLGRGSQLALEVSSAFGSGVAVVRAHPVSDEQRNQ